MSDFIPAPEILFREPQSRFRCHVEGWNPKTQFVHIKTVGGVHTIRTPKSQRQYQTNKRLMLTRKEAARFFSFLKPPEVTGLRTPAASHG